MINNVLPFPNKKERHIKISPKVKEYLIATIGKKETSRMIFFIRSGSYIILTGPSCSAKSTIRYILVAIGYPYVIDDAGIGREVHTTEISGDLKPQSDIFEELGIEMKH